MDSRFETVKNRKLRSEEGIDYLPNLIYPEVPLSEDDYYVIVRVGDRYDKLSYQFYKTVDYWWVIAVANGETGASICPKPGRQIRVPARPFEYVNLFEQKNK